MAFSIPDKIFKFLYFLLSILSIVGVIEILLVKGFFFEKPDYLLIITLITHISIITLYLFWIAGSILKTGWNPRTIMPDLILTGLLVVMKFPVQLGGSLVSFRIIFSLAAVFFKRTQISTFFAQIRLNPSRLLILSFIAAILVGVMLLMFPAATVDHRGASFVDAVFTSTSAVCVTGLIVQDTGSFFSVFGQIIIAILIQLGGLGIMTFSSLFAMIVGRHLGLMHEEHMRGILDQGNRVDIYKLISHIIIITVVFESFGAFLLFFKWLPGMSIQNAAFDAVFHSISAFCNAGFSLYSDSLSRYVDDVYVNVVFMTLIIFGGLGFFVINDLRQNSRHFNPLSIRWHRISAHTKIVIITTMFLLFTGTLFVFFFEFDNTMLKLSTSGKLLAAAFQSVTLRTAGFNTLEISGLKDTTLFLCIVLMFIGASPSSTGGGIKTTTFAVLILSVRSLLLSRNKVEVFNRTISSQTVYKSVAILLFSSSFLILFCVLLLETQEGSFLDILFEATSAIGTVGLSTGVTNHLNGIGKILVSLLMFIGRVGPLTVALALGEVRKVNVEFPSTNISVG